MNEFERKRIEHILDTFSDEEVWGGVSDDEDAEESTTENMSENTDTEQSDLESNTSDSIIDYSNLDLSYHESDDELPLNLRKKYFVGKDGTKWSRRPPNQRIRVASVNHVTEEHGVTEIAKNTKTILEAWSLFFPLEMIEHIVECTNIYIDLNIQSKFGRDRDARPTNIIEIKSVFGILYTIGKYYNL